MALVCLIDLNTFWDFCLVALLLILYLGACKLYRRIFKSKPPIAPLPSPVPQLDGRIVFRVFCTSQISPQWYPSNQEDLV